MRIWLVKMFLFAKLFIYLINLFFFILRLYYIFLFTVLMFGNGMVSNSL